MAHQLLAFVDQHWRDARSDVFTPQVLEAVRSAHPEDKIAARVVIEVLQRAAHVL